MRPRRSRSGYKILQVVQDLQRGAQRIGGGNGVAAFAVDGQQEAADRRSGAVAVVQQRRPVGIAALRRVLAEGREHPPRLGQAGAGGLQGGRFGDGGGGIGQRGF